MAVAPLTTVITTQPAVNQIVIADPFHPRGGRRDWSTSLCGCFEDCPGCLLSSMFPTCYMCYVSSKMGDDACAPCIIGPNALLVMRAHVRGRHNIEGSLIGDACTVQCCWLCALCQLSREVDNIQHGTAPA